MLDAVIQCFGRLLRSIPVTVKPALLAVGLSFLLACAGEHLEDLAGTWTITSWEYTSVADPADHVDWVASFSLSGSLSVTSGGDFTITPGLPAGSDRISGA